MQQSLTNLLEGTWAKELDNQMACWAHWCFKVFHAADGKRQVGLEKYQEIPTSLTTKSQIYVYSTHVHSVGASHRTWWTDWPLGLWVPLPCHSSIYFSSPQHFAPRHLGRHCGVKKCETFLPRNNCNMRDISAPQVRHMWDISAPMRTR